MTATRYRILDSHSASGVADTLLASGISDTDLTIPLTTEPAALATVAVGEQFALLLRDVGGGNEEWVLIDSYNGTLVCTVSASGRGYQGTTPVAHLANDEVFFQPLEAQLKHIIDGEPIEPASVTVYGETAIGDDGILAPAQFTADTHNLDADGCTVLELDTDAAGYALTGILAPSSSKERELYIRYVGADDLTLAEEDAGSTAANRFAFSDVTLTPNQSIHIQYSSAAARWLLIGGSGSGSSAATQIIETSGPDTLDIAAIVDGEYLKRSGTDIVSAAGTGSGSPSWNGLNTFTQPPSSGWTWDNQGGSTITTQTSDQGQTYQALHAALASAAQTRVRYRTAPSAPYTCTFYLEWSYFGGGANGGPLVGFRDSGGKYVFFYAILDTGVASLETAKWSAANTPVAAYSTTVANLVVAGRAWLQISDDNTNLVFRTSVDGKNWRQFDSRARGDYLATAPNAVCFGAYANDSDVEVSLLSYAES